MSKIVEMIVLHLLGLVLAILDAVVWLISLGPIWMVLKLSRRPSNQVIKIGEVDVNGEGMEPSPVFRIKKAANGHLKTPGENRNTAYDILTSSATKFSDRPAQASRTFLRFEKVNPEDRFPARVYGETRYTTYAELREQALSFGYGLRAVGMEPMPERGESLEEKSGAFKMIIYEDTCPEWMVAAQGAFSQSMVVFTSYATLGLDGFVSAVNEGEVHAIMCNYKALSDVLSRLNQMPSVRVVIYNTFLVEGTISPPVPPEGRKVSVKSFAEVLQLGRANRLQPHPPKPKDVAVVMYTSGSTGAPKGVVITHSQIVGCIAGILNVIQSHLVDGEEIYVAYLPLAHILELAAEITMISLGNMLCYTNVNDLLAGPGRAHPSSGGSLAVYGPTCMAGVPKVWERIMKGAQEKAERGPSWQKFLFKLAVRLSALAIKQGRYTPLFNALVFKKVSKMVGGKLKFALSGGGPISAEVQQFIRAAFGCPLVQGYGLTEIAGAVSVQDLESVDLGVNGPPLGSVEVVLHSEPDLTDYAGQPYLTTDKYDADGNPIYGRGEIWVRGVNVTSGYYKKPEKTAEEFDENGFFHTGDIGQVTAKGDLKIVDRKKNLVKLKGGEYIALEQMQTVYNNSQYVDPVKGGVLAYGDATLDRPILLVQVASGPLQRLASELGVAGDDITLAKNKSIVNAVHADLIKTAKAGRLPKLEHAVAVALLTEAWTQENGCLTATHKLQPRAIKNHNKTEIEGLLKFLQK